MAVCSCCSVGIDWWGKVLVVGGVRMLLVGDGRKDWVSVG
jgi:hypothetical protein